jgi:hypothetical protein
MLEDFDLNSIQDIEGARLAIIKLLNLMEELALENRELREEKQRLRDEINRLKGEQGQPDIKPNGSRSRASTSEHSSEPERHKPRERKKRSKVQEIRVDREEVLTVDPAQLPPDAEFKGYEDVVVQDIRIQTDNVRFRKEKYYSAAKGKTYLAELPAGYKGQFGPGVKSLAVVLYFAVNTSEPKIQEFFDHVGVPISPGELSNLLIKDQDGFHAEKDAVYEAGLRSSPWQHIDDTGTRVNGENQHCHIICNPFYTAYFTAEKKDRQTVIDVLRNFQPRTFLLNAEAFTYLQRLRLPAKVLGELASFPQGQELSAEEFTGLLDERLPDLGFRQRVHVLDAAAVAAYQAQVEFPVVDLLIADDAPQFKLVTEELALCWVHDGRHYKKLVPLVAHHRTLLETFLGRYWEFYDKLLLYQTNPTAAEATRLSNEFDELFSTVTGYSALDERIAKSKAKKDCLLLVLVHPEIPLHNNPAEQEARVRVRKRDTSFGPRTLDGRKAWDTFMTLMSTAKKLGVSFYKYIYDRVSDAHEIPNLADLITEQAKQRPLDMSWKPP